MPAKLRANNLITMAFLISIGWFSASLQAKDSAIIEADKPIDLPEMSAEQTAAMNQRIAADKRTPEQMLYEMELQHAALVYDTIKSLPLNLPHKAIKDKRVFTKAESDILTAHANMLLSINAPLYEEELPELFALWTETANLMGEAESLSLYKPPANLSEVTAAWRMFKAVDAATLQAAWVLGPAQVSVDANVAPIRIPAGFKFLAAADHIALKARISAIKQAAITQYKLNNRIKTNASSASNLVMPIEGKWSASIIVVNNRYIDFDGSFTNNQMTSSDAFLATIKSRRDPIANLHWKEAGSYNREAVRWLMPPTRDAKNDSMQWATTNGAVTQAIGIDYAFLKLGANAQVIVTLNNVSVAESLAQSPYLPKGKTAADYKPENKLNTIVASIKPMLDSIQFTAGKQLQQSTAADKQTQVALTQLITGQPTLLEQGAQRIIADSKRKNNFWLFLQDHPRYQASLLAALGVLLVALRTQVNALAPENWSSRLLVISLKMVTIIVLLVGALLVWLHFFIIN